MDDDDNGAIPTSEDPAVDYETIGAEPILNTLQTLISYNGSSSTGLSPQGFAPTLATCVPGTVQCLLDYGSSLIVNNSAGEPEYYTFVIDPAAHFYDPGSERAWQVYPTDVLFSFARDMAWSESFGVGTTAGWLLAQMLLPNGTSSIYQPYNTTPADIYGSMLINDSTYCPSNAMNGVQGNGCITFNVDGQGAAWPTSQFLQVVADGYYGVVSCGWYSHNGANLTGWDAPYNGSGEDSSCLLPDGQSTTDNAAWSSYLASLPVNLWYRYEELLPTDYPSPAPAVQWNLLGSGPYYATVNPTGSPPGYTLDANPAYEQPSGCSGANGLAPYPYSSCAPAAGSYIGQVDVTWSSESVQPVDALRNGTLDFSTFSSPLGLSSAALAGELRNLSNAGKIGYLDTPTLAENFLALNLNWSSSSYNSTGLGEFGQPNVPSDFLSGEAARQLLIRAYSYATADEEYWTASGFPELSPTGGPLAAGMNFYPTNLSYPAGDPVTDASENGSAAWWWAQGTNASSPYFDPQLAACTPSAPCTFDLLLSYGTSQLTPSLHLLIQTVESITGGALQPFVIDYSDLEMGGGGPCTLPCCTEIPPVCSPYDLPGANPATVWNLGWAPDDFSPQDVYPALAYPNGVFTSPDAVSEQLQLPAFDNVSTCGHGVGNLSDLLYWAKQSALSDACEGVAYAVVADLAYNVTHETNPSLQGLEYWAMQAVLNDLGLYLEYGASTQLSVFAPWIAASSVNTNPVLGGAGDQLWYNIRYVPSETRVTFTEKGLPTGASFNVTASSGGGVSQTNTSNGSTSTGFFEPTGPLTYSFTAPAGYAVSRVTGPKGTTTASTTVSGSAKGTKLKVTFVPIETLTFTERGLPAGTPWGVSLIWAAIRTGPPDGLLSQASANASTTGTSLSVNVTKGSWEYSVSVPYGYRASSAKGTVSVAKDPTIRALKFTLVDGQVVFDESGLASGVAWGVTMTYAANGSTACSETGTTSTLTCTLLRGSYRFAVASVAGYSVSPSSGTWTVVDRKVSTVPVTYTYAEPPYTLGMSSPTESAAGSAYYYTITISPSSGLTTGVFGLALDTPVGSSVPSSGAVPSSCAFAPSGTPFGESTCGAPTGTGASWYAVLYWVGNGSIAATYNGSAGWSPSAPVLLTNAENLVVVSAISYTGSSDTLNAFATSSAAVSGASGPF